MRALSVDIKDKKSKSKGAKKDKKTSQYFDESNAKFLTQTRNISPHFFK